MYLRRSYRKKDGKRHAYWALVKSYRIARGPRHRVVSWLGQRDDQERLGVQRTAQWTTGWRQDLFEDRRPQWVEVDVKRVAVERSRRFGSAWLGLGLIELLDQTITTGREDIPWPVMTLVLVLGRLCDPSSELHLAEHFFEFSALGELLGIPAGKMNDDRLYRGLDRLLPHSKALERHFDYDLLLYDVTSNYFEGQGERNSMAQRGYSRDHRPDSRQVNIALVVSRRGMPLVYRIIRRKHGRCQHGGRECGRTLWQGKSDLGDGSRHGQSGEYEVPPAPGAGWGRGVHSVPERAADREGTGDA